MTGVIANRAGQQETGDDELCPIESGPMEGGPMMAAMPAQGRKARVARDFGRAAAGYDAMARLQRHVGEQLLLQAMPGAADHLVDLGCGTGYFLPELSRTFRPVQLTAVDLSPAMIAQARSTRAVSAQWLVADAESVPLPSASVDLLFSSLMIQWCEDLPAVAREIHRLLRPGAEAVVSTLVSGTLHELRSAWDVVDPGVPHVNHFWSLAEVKSQLGAAFSDLEIVTEPVTLWYPDVMALLRELKGLGARHKDGGRTSATSPGRLRALVAAYDDYRDGDQGVPATYQVAYIRLKKQEL